MEIVRFLDKPAAIVGTTGAGKTFAAKGAVEHLLDQGRRVVIIDPTGAWYGLRAGADGSADGGFPVLIFGGDHADIPVSADAGAELAEAIGGRDVQAIVDTSEMTGGEKVRFLTAFLEKLYALNKAALHLVVDEADEVCPQNPMPDERRLSGAFDKIVRRGRIKGFRPLMITQRPAVLHKNVLSQIGTLVALKLTSPQDRKAIEDWVKGNADASQARAVMSSLPTLKRGEGWVWSPADEVLERVRFPSIRTFDSSRTPADGEALVAPALTAVDVDALREAMKAPEPAPPSGGTAGGRANSKAEIEAAEKRGYERGWHAGIEEGEKRGATKGAAVALAAVRNALEALRIPDMVVDVASTAFPASSNGRTSAFDAANRGSNPRAGTKPATDRTRPTVVPGSLQTSPGIPLGAERKPLAVLVASYPAGYTEPQWASLAGFKRKGGTWGTYKSRLRTKELIEQRGYLWFATPAAVEAIGDDLPPMPSTPDERLAMWKSTVSGVGPMLDTLRNFYPKLIGRDDLAQQTGLTAGGGTFGTYLSRLRSNGIIEEPERGRYRLSAAIMGEA